MDIDVYKLTPERINDFLYFFENVAHTDNKDWDRCYCINYCAAHNNRILKNKKILNPEIRKAFAIEYIKNGLLQGYLACFNNNVIGWCNTNNRNNCLHCYGWKNFISDKYTNKKVNVNIKSIFCFTVAPEYRGKGVATAMLKKCISDAQIDGYDYLEAYPNKEDTDEYYNYVGPFNLYKKFDFKVFSETKWRFILRKKL